MPEISFNLSQWALQTVAMLVTALLIPKLKIDGPLPAFLTVLTLGFINSHLWSAALFFEIPDSITKQTLALLLTNGVIFWVVVKLLPGIECEGLFPALIAPVVFTGTMILISRYGDQIDWKELGKVLLALIGELRDYVSSPPASPPPPDHSHSLLFQLFKTSPA